MVKNSSEVWSSLKHVKVFSRTFLGFAHADLVVPRFLKKHANVLFEFVVLAFVTRHHLCVMVDTLLLISGRLAVLATPILFVSGHLVL